jgi:hypothetical protein
VVGPQLTLPQEDTVGPQLTAHTPPGRHGRSTAHTPPGRCGRSTAVSIWVEVSVRKKSFYFFLHEFRRILLSQSLYCCFPKSVILTVARKVYGVLVYGQML